MTSAPADRLKLAGRGRIAPGAVADLVLFNPKTVIDRSTFSDPGVLASGMEKVFVDGELVWDGGKVAAGRPGRVIASDSRDGQP
jgi:N-acyl-D-amino-acid deacylase